MVRNVCLSPFLAVAALATALAVAGAPRVATAQVSQLCGDVDQSGAVTVTDGVQILRAAAGLSSSCTLALCDFDVNGTIGVTDGVNALRKAAGLFLTENCIPNDGQIDLEIEHLIQRAAPLYLDVASNLTTHRGQLTETELQCDNVDDGTLDLSFDDGLEASYSTCLVGNTFIDGEVDNITRALDWSNGIEISDTRSDETVDVDDGTLFSTNVAQGVKYSGNLDCSPSFDNFDELGEFLLVFNSMIYTPDGAIVGGSVNYEAFDDFPPATDIKQSFDGSNLSRVTVTFPDGSFADYRYDTTFRRFLSATDK